MQTRIWKDEHLKSYCNGFCDCEKSVLTKKFELDKCKELFDQKDYFSKEELVDIYKYVVYSNLDEDVKDLTILAQEPSIMFKVMKEAKMNGTILFDGKEILREIVLSSDKKLEKEIKNIMQSGNIKAGIYISSLLDYSDAEITNIYQFVMDKDIPVYINFCRTLDEAGTLDKTYSKSPARVLEDFGLLDKKAYIIGCNFVDKDDALILAATNAEIILTPISDMLLGRGIVNLEMLKSAGVKVRVGSDIYCKYNMLNEGLLAKGNTANIMFDPDLITKQDLEDMVTSDLDVDEMLTQVRLEQQTQKVDEIFRRKK